MNEFEKIEEYLKKLDVDLIIERYEGFDIHTSNRVNDNVILINGERVYVEIKREIRPQHFPNLEHFFQFNEPLLIVADYITPKSKEILRKKRINYLDSYGNGYLYLKYLKIYIEKSDAKPVYLKNYQSFSASGGQVLFYLLKYPERVNETYRNIATKSLVSLGTVSKTFKTLIDKGYIVKWNIEQKYQLVRLEELLHEWVQVLNEKILPAHKVGNFSQSRNEIGFWKEISIGSFSKWGGESGASRLTNYLNPEKIRIYTRLQKRDIFSTMRLFQDENGNIEIYEPFWESEMILHDANSNHYNKFQTVHPLIIYAELMYNEIDRNIEVANIIYNEYIKPNL